MAVLEDLLEKPVLEWSVEDLRHHLEQSYKIGLTTKKPKTTNKQKRIESLLQELEPEVLKILEKEVLNEQNC